MGVLHALFFWPLITIFFTIYLLVLVVSRSNPTFMKELPTVSSEPQVQFLNHQINAKSAKLLMLTEKIKDIKETINSLEYKKGQIKSEYCKLLNELKGTLSKSEFEFKALHSQIQNLAEERLKMISSLEKAAV